MSTVENKHENFLELNGKPIIFINKDGKVWIYLQSLCKALNIDANRYYKNAKKDPILGPELAKQPVQVSKNGLSQIRNVTCIPEDWVYGWLFTVNSDSPELLEYKRTCYKLLRDHFHGTISNRKELLVTRSSISTKIHKLTQELKTKEDRYKEVEKLKKERAAINRKLNSIDKEFENQPGFWD